MAGYPLHPKVRASARCDVIGAARLPAMHVNNGFILNGLCEIEVKGNASAWPLAGTLIPISDTEKERMLYQERSPDSGDFSSLKARSLWPRSVHELCARSRDGSEVLQNGLVPVFERFLHLVQELVGDRAVHHAMVVAERHVAHRADGDRVVDDYRALLDGAETKDTHVGLADDRQAEQAAKDARVGNRERAFLHFLGLQLFRTRALREVVHVALDAENVFLVGVFHHRDEQAPVERHGDADVDLLVQDHIGAVERGVQRREGAQPRDRGLHEERHERQLGLVALFEFVLGLRAQGGHLGHVDFVDRVHVRGHTLRRHHVLGDALPHGAHRLHFVIAEVHLFARHGRFERYVRLSAGDPRSGCRWWWRGPRRRCRSRSGVSRSGSSRDHRFDILLADSPARAGTLHTGKVDAVLLGHASYQRRTVNPLARGTRRNRTSRNRRGNRSRSRGPRRCRSHGGRGFCRSRSGRSRFHWGRRRGCGARRINHANDRLNRHGLAFADLDLLQHARGRRWNFRVHLVSGNLKQRLVTLHLVAGLFQPLGDRAFENAFPHLGHYDVNGHFSFSSRSAACKSYKVSRIWGFPSNSDKRLDEVRFLYALRGYMDLQA